MKKTTIIASAVALALGVSACSEQKTLEQLLASANEYSQKRDFNSAIVELKNAVRLSPKSAEARLALGSAYLEQGNYIFAEKELEKSLELGVNFSDVATLLARTKAKLSKYEDLQALVLKSSDLNDSDYIKVLIYAGVSALGNDNREQAQDYIGQANAISESSAYSQLGKAYLSQSEEGYSQALVDIQTVLAESPDLSEAILLLGHIQFALEDYEVSADTFAKYIELHPLEYSINYFQINSLIKAELYDEAEVLTNKILKQFKDAPLALHYKAQLQYQNKNYAEAKNNAEQAIQAGITLPLTKLIAGTSAYQLKDYEQAYNHLKPIEPYLTATHPIQKIVAIVKLQLGYNSEAAENIISLEGLTGEDSAFLQSTTANLIELGDFDSAQKLIEKASVIDPNNAHVLVQSGNIYISQNNVEGAISSLERAIELDPSLIDVELALGMQYLKANDDSKAKDIANKLVSEYSNNVAGYILQGVIFTKENNQAKAIEAFNKALSISPNNIASLYNLGMLFKTDENPTKTMDYLERVIRLAPSHEGALSNYMALAAKHKKLNHSVNFLKEINNGNNLIVTIALAQSLRLNGLGQEAISVLETFSQKENLTIRYWVLLGDLHLHLQDINKARVAFSEGLKLKPKNYLLNLRMIGIYELLKNYPEALNQTKSTYANYPNNTRVEILLAHFEAKNNNTDTAKKMINKLKQKKVENPLIDGAIGSMALVEKNYERAIESYSLAFEKLQSEEYAIHLARALKFNDQQAEAEKALEGFLNTTTDSNKIKSRFLLAQLYSEDDINKKITQYQAIVNESSENVVALNNLAWNLYKNEQFSDALIYAEKAYQLGPEILAVIETYGMALMAVNKLDEAIIMFEKAIAKGSTDQQLRINLEKAQLLSSKN